MTGKRNRGTNGELPKAPDSVFNKKIPQSVLFRAAFYRYLRRISLVVSTGLLLIIVILSAKEAILGGTSSFVNVLNSAKEVIVSKNSLVLGLGGLAVYFFLYLATWSLLIATYLGSVTATWTVKQSWRFLAAIPTPLLGSVILYLFNHLGIIPSNVIGQFIFLLCFFVFLAIPTSMSACIPIMYETERAGFVTASALGADPPRAVDVLLNSVKKSISSAILIGLSRVSIEGYIIISQSGLLSADRKITENSIQSLFDTFINVYSEMTVKDNVVMILILFLLAFGLGLSIRLGFGAKA